MPINHMIAVTKSFLESNPWAVREVFSLLTESKEVAGLLPVNGMDQFLLGVEANRNSLEMGIKHAVRQRLIPPRFEDDDLFDDVTRVRSE